MGRLLRLTEVEQAPSVRHDQHLRGVAGGLQTFGHALRFLQGAAAYRVLRARTGRGRERTRPCTRAMPAVASFGSRRRWKRRIRPASASAPRRRERVQERPERSPAYQYGKVGDRVVGHDRLDAIGIMRGHEQADDRAFREAERTDAVLIDLRVCARRIDDQREVAGRLPGEHARAVFPLDAALIVSGDRDVSARREIPDHSVHVGGCRLFLRKNDHRGERSYTGRTRPLDVHLELIAGEVGRPDDYLRSRLGGMDEMVIRLRTTHEKDHADSEQGRRASTDPSPPSWRVVVSVDQSRRQGGWSIRDSATRLGTVRDHGTSPSSRSASLHAFPVTIRCSPLSHAATVASCICPLHASGPRLQKAENCK